MLIVVGVRYIWKEAINVFEATPFSNFSLVTTTGRDARQRETESSLVGFTGCAAKIGKAANVSSKSAALLSTIDTIVDTIMYCCVAGTPKNNTGDQAV